MAKWADGQYNSTYARLGIIGMSAYYDTTAPKGASPEGNYRFTVGDYKSKRGYPGMAEAQRAAEIFAKSSLEAALRKLEEE